MNALRHDGILSLSPAVPRTERAGNRERHRAAFVDSCWLVTIRETALMMRKSPWPRNMFIVSKNVDIFY
jgi:hypothetical protein